MTTSQWNDLTIPDEDWLYRRVPRTNHFYDHIDLITHERRLGRGAFRFDDDGMSVHRHALVIRHHLTARQLRRDDKADLWRFQVGNARKLDAGVVDDPDPYDPPIGVAHASVRCHPEIRPPKKKRDTIARGLIAVAEFVEGEIP